MPNRPDQDSEALVIAMLAPFAANMVTSRPTTQRATDRTLVLLWGPCPISRDELDELPAIQRTRRERLPVVFLSGREWLTVATGGVVAVPDEHVADLDRPVQVRLATWEEAMQFSRDTVAETDEMMRDAPGWKGPPPLDKKRAIELTTPIKIPAELLAAVAAVDSEQHHAQLKKFRYR